MHAATPHPLDWHPHMLPVLGLYIPFAKFFVNTLLR